MRVVYAEKLNSRRGRCFFAFFLGLGSDSDVDCAGGGCAADDDGRGWEEEEDVDVDVVIELWVAVNSLMCVISSSRVQVS